MEKKLSLKYPLTKKESEKRMMIKALKELNEGHRQEIKRNNKEIRKLKK